MKSRMTHGALCAAAVALASLSVGCSSITGLDGSSTYACKAPEGIKCDSVSGTYHNAVQNNLPAQRRSSLPARPSEGSGTQPTLQPIVATSPSASPGYAASPLRSQPRILRLWVKPWEDADRDLNGESVVFVQVDNGQWLVDRVQRQAREPYAPIKASKKASTAATGAAGKNEGAAPVDPAAIAQAMRNRQANDSTD
jgi:conjugal transfer pilus assembly protein TraV